MAVTIREVAEKQIKASYDELYQQLNEGQRQAVDALEGPVMVLAGPGTGKTQVLAMRIANILRSTDMDPWNVLCLTFTESAAVAMRQRLLLIIGEAAYHVRIYTFHSFCNDVIQAHPEFFAQNTQWQVLADVERVMLIRSLLDQLPGTSPLKPFGHPYVYVPDVLQAISWLKKEGVSSETLWSLLDATEHFLSGAHELFVSFFTLSHTQRTDADCERLIERLQVLCHDLKVGQTIWPAWEGLATRYREAAAAALGKREAGKARTAFKNALKKLYDRMSNQLPRQRDLGGVYQSYQQELLRLGRYDYEDMIIQVLEKFRLNDLLLAGYQEQYQYILVDEYQDTNGAQNEVVRLLGSFYPNPNIFVVGDDKQSIFRFQGASLENLLSFYEHYQPDVQLVSLTQNYRSQQVVLDAASGLISHNIASVERVLPHVQQTLVAQTGRAAPLVHRQFATDDEEHYYVALKIKELIGSGVDPNEIAVLYRYNRDAVPLLDALLRMNIPVYVSAGGNVLDDRRVHQLLQLLRYVADGQRDEILAEVLHYDFWSLNALDVVKAVHYAGHKRLGLFMVLSDAKALSRAGVAAPATFEDFIAQLVRWKKLAANDTLQRLFDVVLQESGLLTATLRDDAQLVELHRITTLFNELQRLNQLDSHLRLPDFLARLQILEEYGLSLTAEGWQTKATAVQLMTAHRSKGLEFEHVFLIHLVDRHWGNIRERGRLSLPLGILRHDPISGQENNEDERRLFYVALTRAKQQVYLSHAQQSADGRARLPSLFLKELPPACLEDITMTESESAMLQRLTMTRLAQPAGLVVADDVRTWLSGQLRSYAMSVTHLNNYLACPILFYYRNILQVPAAKTKHMAFGTAVHTALRDLFWRINQDQTIPTADYLIKQFHFYLDREVLTDNDRSDSAALGEAALSGYYQHYATGFAPRTLLEYDFRSHGAHLDGLVLTGKLDKIEIIDAKNKLINVVDYKTGNPDNAAARLREGGAYRRQLVFYKLLCETAPRFDYAMVSAELDFVQPSSRSGKFLKKKFTVSVGEVEELKETIRQAWKDISSLAFLDFEGCGECDYCRFRAQA